ncbi:uncharacterized protein [Acropora muricata]|uniref:uncharacterized protein n=1 Tax=Acropora muricata TaxID=159855 RepID=UPI0034E52D85
MKSASSDYSCIWCEIHAKDRFDMTKPQNKYWKDHIARKLDGIIEDAKKKRHSCEHQPFLNIPLENLILNELHLMLRITDRLTGNLVKYALEWDNKENFDKPPSQQSDKHLQALVKAMKNCGVSFNVWEKLNGDGKGSGLYAFTSLMGSDKKLLLKKLPDNLQGAIRPETSATFIQIWRDFDALYKDIGQKYSSEEQASQFFEKGLKNLMMIVGGFIYRDPINGMHQKIPSLWENEWNIYLSMKGLQESTESRSQSTGI